MKKIFTIMLVAVILMMSTVSCSSNTSSYNSAPDGYYKYIDKAVDKLP